MAQFVKNPPDMQETDCNTGDTGLIPGSVKSPEEGNGNPLQCSCLENSVDIGVHKVAKHQTQLTN